MGLDPDCFRFVRPDPGRFRAPKIYIMTLFTVPSDIFAEPASPTWLPDCSTN